MNSRKITLKRLVWGAAITLLLGCYAVTAQQSQRKKIGGSADSDSQASSMREIAGYKQWTRVNQEPAIIPSRIAVQCVFPTKEQRALEEHNPHRDKFVVVYVNGVGKQAMLGKKFPRFPLGTVIVKEKLPTQDSTTPELLTVMIKQEKGFNPENGDWEYLVSDGAGAKVQARGRLENCQNCHRSERQTDFVYRNYLSEADRGKLR